MARASSEADFVAQGDPFAAETCVKLIFENAALRMALARKHEPDGQRAEQVAEWLRSHGYVVARGPEADRLEAEAAAEMRKVLLNV